MRHWEVFDDLVRLETMMWNALDAALLDRCGIGLGAFNALTVVDRASACRVHDLAVALAITVGGASQAVDRFEAQGLLLRRPNPANRRSSLLELTSAGLDRLAAGRDVVDGEIARWLIDPLGDAPAARFAKSLSLLRGAAGTRASGPVDGAD
ncbi:MarR family winged helix-turn-helix transcriptional regulator [Amycolatopsis sp. PS_44_ISF1]|uniref:MarR family winged helix-turn-helix transcriptional regulator n=1 Tax=Amycolatopsis sp. PS_44_ISF1 TaxID=2974917 RepID=UPI0028DFC9C3|nr:MarR family winged helix-turn-helix transcriptional regulator [Amycolatopsis sp. PS_44_ISF1]MDT8912410.1 MarR family winged helix-turn-helix transcriptional regulator [Amycolatopsis sp. PS_44_ISF1]